MTGVEKVREWRKEARCGAATRSHWFPVIIKRHGPEFESAQRRCHAACLAYGAYLRGLIECGMCCGCGAPDIKDAISTWKGIINDRSSTQAKGHAEEDQL